MPLGVEVGLGPGHIVQDGDPAPPHKKGAQPPIFGPCLLWSKGWMDQDATWYGGRPRPRPHCDRWEPSSLIRGTAALQFSARVYCGLLGGWINMLLGTEVGLSTDDTVLYDTYR